MTPGPVRTPVALTRMRAHVHVRTHPFQPLRTSPLPLVDAPGLISAVPVGLPLPP